MTSKTTTYRLFEGKDHAQLYAKYRPSYPKELYDKIKDYCQQSDATKLDVAIDVGCGSGQSTLPLTNICKHVIGIDISRAQIAEAKKVASDIDFRVGQAEDLGFLGDGTVDLVTTATAIHWMDIPTLMGEVSRVLRPGGVVAVYSFAPDVIHNKEAHQLVWEDFFNGTLRGCGSDAHIHYINGLALIDLPFKDAIRLEPLMTEREVDVDFFIGFIKSCSSWQVFQKKNPDSNVLIDLRLRLRTLYGDSTSGEVRPMSLSTPVYTLLGRKGNL
ncbi:putative methyltransferase DDB_G0268948 [Mizuhopecten yessoensis]|uniref:Methyltransferase n=1 Tax=Mizuhopecten yessoensis TaxID=6573 RepID=A0A210R4R4_MIZYE|nr:putative methyltransferase DDB_G0268948 [Mizuhopecten yessoensis]OWF55946.1 Methyltransferase [Mizuhopecten yessoensis]